MSTVETDGRTARARRTRAAIVDALVDLVREGVVEPSAGQIAERAGVSKRSVFVHFATLDDLHRAVAERATAMVVDLVWVVDPELPLASRIAAICDQRAAIHEEVGPLRRAASRHLASSAALSESRRLSHRASRDQVARVFRSELAMLTASQRRRRVAAIEAILAGETWDLWRTMEEMTVDGARACLREGLTALLEPSPIREPGSRR